VGVVSVTAEVPALLYSFRRCPYAIRARMALACAGLTVRIREVSLREKPAELLALSPKATVPVLQLSDGQVIEESLDIMAWALRQRDPQAWLALAPADADRARQWVARNDETFKPLLDRYKYATRHPALTPQQHRERAMDAFVLSLDAALRSHPFVLGDVACWADVALFPFARQFAMVDPAWFAQAPLPGVRQWLAYWTGGALFQQVMSRAGEGKAAL
jgi:glutathione S-transferase